MWRAICYLWVLIPVLGWLPSIPQKLSMPWLTGIVSIAAISAGITQKVIRVEKIKWTGAWLFGCLAIFIIHQTQFGMASKWLTTSVLIILAAHIICERGSVQWLIKAIILASFIQILICLIQLKFHLYIVGGNPPWGSLGDRIDLGILWAMASILTEGWVAWCFALLTLLTLSLTAIVPAILNLIWPNKRLRVLFLVGVLAALFLHPGTHWATRYSVWKGISSWPVHPLNKVNAFLGYGFLSFPGGFSYDDSVSQLLGVRDLHCVWLDWIVRTGLIGSIMLGALLIWAWRRTVAFKAYGLFFLALWVGTWQSMEGRPLLVILALVWLIYLQGGNDGRIHS